MTENLIDPQAWETVKAMTDSTFLAELIDLYLVDSPDLIQQMHDGLAAGDLESLRRAAHSLKSNSATLGATHLAGLAREVEMIAKNGTREGATEKIAEIETEFAQITSVLTELKHES